MDVNTLTMEPKEAEKLYRKYQTHRHNQTKIDGDIERIYKAIAQGKTVINAFASIIKAGLGDDRLPRLAIARADDKECWLRAWSNGRCTMSGTRWINGNTAKSRYHEFEDGSFPNIDNSRDHAAMVPYIPPDIRPRRGIQNYHILWEATWEQRAPVDPYLLRHYGGDIWLVLAGWDLTPVERAVMEIHNQRQSRRW